MRCAVVGDPVAHSLSPVLHAAAYALLGLDGTYDAHRVPAGGLAAFVRGPAAAWHGLSVTMPLKREALELADTLDPAARRAGGVNTLVLADGLRGHNTDVPGAVAALRERGVTPGVVTVLGGGATAASVGIAACDLGARRVRFLARDAARAADAAAAVAAHAAAPVVEVDRLAPGSVVGDLVVSTVPTDAQDPALVAACLAAVAPAGGAVFEALYDPWPTPLAAAAHGAGVSVVGGLDLLVHQAALQLVLFAAPALGDPVEPGDPGVRVPAGCVEAMRDAGLAVLRARQP